MTRQGIAILLFAILATPVGDARVLQLEVFLQQQDDGPLYITPTSIEANVGETLALTVYNVGGSNGSAHDLVLCAEAADEVERCAKPLGRTAAIPPSGVERMTVELTRGGDFQYFCELGCPRDSRIPEKGIAAGMLSVTGDMGEDPKNGTPLGVAALLVALAVAARRRGRPR